MKKNFTLRGLLTTILLSVGALAMAQSCLVVQLKDGSAHYYVLAEQPKITFQGTTLDIAAAEAQTQIDLVEVQDFHFTDQPDGIANIKGGDTRFSYLNNVVRVSGVDGISIYDTAGNLITSAKGSGSETVIDLNSQPAGTYIVRMGSRSVKVRVKH